MSSDDVGQQPRRRQRLDPSLPGQKVARSAARAVGTITVAVAIYYLLPLDHISTPAAMIILVLGLIVLIALIVWQARAIIASPYPGVRGVDALATTVPLFLVLFAATYVVMATATAANFSQPLTRTDALYFTVTVFATVGFGDITAKTELARIVVTLQMVADIVIIGAGIKILTTAVRRGQQRRPGPDGTESSD
jgi:hypothetical protein